MPLIQSPVNLSPVEQGKRQLDQAMQHLYVAVRNVLGTGKRVVWQNPRVTPQEMFDAYGNNAALLCLLSEKLKELLQIGAGDDFGPILPPGKTLTINEDGTVTVGDANG